MLFNNNKKVLKRYERVGKNYIISITTNKFRDLFSDFDRASSFIRRDLDYDFADYLYESALDLVSKPFIIKLNILSEKRSSELEDKVNRGIDNYFEYETDKIDLNIRNIVKKMLIHVLLAIVCFFTSFTLNKYFKIKAFYYMIFIESVIIAAWVFMWPVFSDFIYEILNEYKTKKIYKKLIEAELQFEYDL